MSQIPDETFDLGEIHIFKIIHCFSPKCQIFHVEAPFLGWGQLNGFVHGGQRNPEDGGDFVVESAFVVMNARNVGHGFEGFAVASTFGVGGSEGRRSGNLQNSCINIGSIFGIFGIDESDVESQNRGEVTLSIGDIRKGDLKC